MTTEVDIFEDFRNGAEIAGYIYSIKGKEGLRALLDLIIHDQRMSRDDLIEMADGLERGSLGEAAHLVRQAATDIPGQTEIELAAILAHDIPGNRRAWLAGMYREGSISIDDLVDAGVDEADIDYVSRAINPHARKRRSP